MHLRSVTFHPQQYPTDNRYPFSLATFRQTEQITFTTPVTLFVGENGTGKSTLLEALARACRIFIWRDSERRPFEHNPYEDKLGDYISVQWADGRVPIAPIDYEETEHYRLYRSFMEDRHRYLQEA